MARKEELRIFTGNANRRLTERICEYLNLPVGRADVGRFPDGEIDVKINEDVRGSDVYILQSTCPPVNETLLELLVLIDALRRASADRITAVIPYFGYARQDRKAEGRVPITAKLVANLITTAGANRVLTMDLHAAQIQGFFDIPVDHLFAAPVLIEYFRKMELPNPVVLSCDVGGAKMARAYARRLNCGLAITDKRRIGPHETDVHHIIGDIEGKNVILVDDMVSTGSSIVQALRAAKERGALSLHVCATHPIFCGQAVPKLEAVKPSSVVVSDTIPLNKDKERDWIRVLSVANLLGEAIRRIHRAESVSSLFV
ncbi:MAG: ribose-phosphate pyrophosphokinase [Planctomycetes bacterium]|nr:ribose-phosphate pyrophosphokinase [Planctomycetota bacterium]